MQEFVHLHLHSEYSLLDGACRVSEIPQRAAECGHRAVALTDHGVMYGAVAFYQACLKAGVKPIIGCEVYVASDSRFSKTPASGSPFHLVLLCENIVGYQNLIYLVSKGFTEGFYSRPRIDMELLREHSDGLIALSACLAGRIPKLLSKGDYESAKQAALEYSQIFGKDHFYIELQNHGLEEQRLILPELVKLAEECQLPMVATNDCHYLRRRDAEAQAVLMCIQTGTTVSDAKFGFETDEFYYKDTNEMSRLFGNYPGALENTVKIADRCQVEFDFSKTYLPKFPCPSGITAPEYLTRLAEDGFEQKFREGVIPFGSHSAEEYRERMKYELAVIVKMGYADYFLIVQDYVNFARSRDIPVGPGRGSGAGSLVAYLLGITDVDSIRYNLLFERFLNPERVSMPDIDIDFCYNRRDEVIAYIADKYGRDHTSQIITFGTLAARAAIRDVGRALGMPYGDVDIVARAIPQELDITIEKALKRKELKEQYESSDKVRKLIDTAMAIEGMPRNISIHAAGIVITDRPLTEYLPLAVSNGAVVTQYDMDTVSHLGLLKFDFLALRYLTIIHDAVLQIREKQPDFQIEQIPLDDKSTYDLISKGNTLGVFQLESSGMRNMLTGLKPENLDDIIAAIALFRPGPMDSIPQYIEARHHPEKIHYVVPELEPILQSTYGCTVYQEQVMSIFRELAGYTFGHADVVRRAMAKKKADVLEAERTDFLSGCVSRGIDAGTASRLFDDMSAFANYAFNKSHAAAYAIISYRTAYLKVHYAKEYFAALLTSVLGNLPKMAEYKTECSKYRIQVLAPNINESHMDFHVDGENIRFGLLALKNIGKQFVESILSERKNRPFSSFEDFVTRMSAYDLNKRMVECLVKAGAFDSLGTRSQLVAGYEAILEAQGNKNRSNLDGQLDMFATPMLANDSPRYVLPNVPEYSLREKLQLEKDASGMYFSGHPFDSYASLAEPFGAVSLSELMTIENDNPLYEDKKQITVSGIVMAISMKTQKNTGDKMAFFTLEDSGGEIECLAFAKCYTKYGHLIQVDQPLLVKGTISRREEELPKILVNSIYLLQEGMLPRSDASEPQPANTEQLQSHPSESMPEKSKPAGVHPHRLCLRLPNLEGELFLKTKNLIELFEGPTSVLLYDSSNKTYHRMGGIFYSEYVRREFACLLGEENVVYQ